MQGTTKIVANMEDPSLEAKAKVSGCESLHKPEKKTVEKMHASVPGLEHGAVHWI